MGGTWARGRNARRTGLHWDSGGETAVSGFLEKSPKKTSVAGGWAMGKKGSNELRNEKGKTKRGLSGDGGRA